MTKPLRVVIAQVCLSADGRYSVDAPGLDQGGTRGFGTVEVGDGGLSETLRYLEGGLKFWHEDSLHQVRELQKKRRLTCPAPAPEDGEAL